MPAHRPALVLVVLLLAAVAVPAVSALEPYNESFTTFSDVTLETKAGANGGGSGSSPICLIVYPAESFTAIQIKNVEEISNWNITPTFKAAELQDKWSYTWSNIPLKIGSDVVGTGTLGYYRYGDLGRWCKTYLYIDTLDLSGYTGIQRINFDVSAYDIDDIRIGNYESSTAVVTPSNPRAHFGWSDYNMQNEVNLGAAYRALAGYPRTDIPINSYAICWDTWRIDCNITPIERHDAADFSITRTFDGVTSLGYVTLKSHDGELLRYDATSNDFSVNYLPAVYWPLNLTITNPTTGDTYNRIIGATAEPTPTPTPTTTTATATVYVQSSQTGALLANANLAILASTGGTEVEIINATLPGGIGAYTLQPTGGGIPNPDYYRAVATVSGYTQIVENHSFTLTGPHDVIIEMRPDSGGPTAPENCYLEFYVRDFSANGIASASIQCNSQFKQTNSAGYAVFEVAKNATYPYKVSKSGYVTIEGTATVEALPRYVANIVLGPGSVPTYTPTSGPGETPGGPGATPTPDTRTNEEKGQEVIDLLADFALPIAILAILATLSGLLSMMMPRRR